MTKCRTCKHWNYQGFGIGKCSGITGSPFVIPIPNQPKGKPNGKLVNPRPGLITNATYLATPEDFNCKNWKRK